MTSPDLIQRQAAYVPAPVTQAIYNGSQPLDAPLARHFSAIVLFSDISGFTKLSELLSTAGPTGTEELTYLINQYFTEMIQITQAYHGQVVKFSGDALTVLFQINEDSLTSAARRAGECALAMQVKMSGFATLTTSMGPASLSMKVGIGTGQVFECSAGGVLGRWEYLVAGQPLTQVALAEHYASPGQIIVSPQLWHLAQDFFIGTEIIDGFVQVHKIVTPLTLTRPVNPNWRKLTPHQLQIAEKAMECYLPGAVKARLGKEADWLAELRRMSVVFIGINGLNYESPQAVEQIQNLLQATQELVYRFEGSLNKVAVDDKGTVMLVLFGAPPFFHEDDPTRAVAFGLGLQTVAQTQDLKISIGITEGIIFAGPVGAPNRREYTVIGDQVNLAARLMQYGKAGMVIISNRVKERAGPQFITENLGEVSLKGKAQSQIVHLAKGELGAQEEFVTRYLLYDAALIGRQEEVTQLQQIAHRASQGQLQLLFIEGELGIGKSRLVSELVRDWMMTGGAGYGGKCISYDRQVSYRVWREVLTAIYGLTPTLSPQRQLIRLATSIAKLEDPPNQPDYWANRLPLLADVLGLDVPDNDFTRTISGQLRRNNTFALIEMILQSEVKRRPLLILLEDIHWADELSLSLAAYLAQKMAGTPLLLVLVHRPMPPEDVMGLVDIKELPYAHTISLNPLSSQESLDFINTILSGKTLTDKDKEMLLVRGQGNPLFLQEITTAIINVVASSSDQTITSLNLPDTVQDVILTHLDRLAEAERMTLKIASVIGPHFQRSLLAAVHPIQQTAFTLSNQLNKLQKEKLIQLDMPAPKWEYNFYNVVVQEVVYEGLLLAQRRQLHGVVATALEKLAPDNVERLAFHFSRSNNTEKALKYLYIASEKARREYANQAAIDYYSELLKYLPHTDIGRFSAEYWDVLLKRTQLYNLIGQRDDELEDLGTLGILAEALNDDYRKALSAKQWANLYEISSDYDSSIEMIERCVQLAHQAQAEQLVGKGYNQWGKLLYLRGDFETAHQYFQQSLLVAQKLDDKDTQADCLNSLGIVAYDQNDYEVAQYFFQEAIDLWQTIGNQMGLGKSLTHLGQVYYNLNQYMAAQHCYEQSLVLHQTIGDRAGFAFAQLHLGQAQRTLGDFKIARALLEEALAFYLSIGDLRHEAHCLYHLGFLYYRLADTELALTYLEEALVVLRDLNDPWALIHTLNYAAWVLTDIGQLTQAQNYLEEILTTEHNTDHKTLNPETLVHLARVSFGSHNLASALLLGQQALAIIDSYGPTIAEHPVMIYLTCYHIFQAQQDPKQAQNVLSQGQDYLQNQLEQVKDPALQYNYLNHIAENRALWSLTEDNN